VGNVADERAVARPGVAVQGPQIGDDLGAERVEVEIPDQFQEVGLRLHHDGLVPVLEEVADAFVAPIEGPRVPGEQRPHEERNRRFRTKSGRHRGAVGGAWWT
jgi:hypothetical protein